MKHTHPTIVKAVIETLEDRRLMSAVSFEEGVLKIEGDADNANRMSVWYSANSNAIKGWNGKQGEIITVPAGQVKSVEFTGGSGNDRYYVDPSVKLPVSIDRNGGNDTVVGGNQQISYIAPAKPQVSAPDNVSLPSGVTFEDGVLKIEGDADKANQMSVWYSANSNTIKGWNGKEGEILAVPASQVKSVEFTGGSGNDRYYVDPSVKLPVSIDRNGGDDTVVGGNKQISFVGSTKPQPPAPELPPRPSTGNNTNGNVKPVDTNTGGSTDEGSNTGGGNNNGAGTDNEWDDTDDNTGEAGAPNPAISVLSTGPAAGQAVHVNGLKSSLGTGTAIEARYEWNFGDEGGRYNVVKGFNAAHVYDKAGTYTVTLKITNKSGKVAYETTKVTVAADNRRVIYVDAQGNDANSGTSSSAAVRTWDRARQLIDDNTEILFNRGDTFAVGSSMNIDATNVVIGAYGSGSRPVLNWTGANASTLIGMTSNARNVSIQDLAFNSSGSNVAMAVKPQGTNITVRNNEFISAYYGVNNNGKPTGVLIQDNQVTKANGIKSYFVWVAGTDIVILGNTSVATGESNIRMSQYERVNISENTLRDNDKATVIAQKGSYVYVSGNDIYDANMGAGPLGKGDGLAQDPDYKTVRTQWVVFEDNHLYNTGIGIVHGAEHVMIRNNVVERNGGVAFSVEGYDSAYERTASDVQIIGNTATNNSTQGNFLKTWAGNKYLVVKNNVYVAPNLQTGAYNTAAMYVLAGNLNGFSEISGNIWPTVNALAYANGGTHYLWASWSNSEGYKDGKEWEAYSQVQNDVYQNVTLKNTYTASVGGVTAGSSLDKAA